MAQNHSISIPQPCSQDWEQMSVTEKGRFCASCQKHVLDFTSLSDREIENILKGSKTICGRFNSSQLNRELIVPKVKSSFWIAAATGVLAFLGPGNTEALAQTTVKSEQNPIKKQPGKKRNTLHKEKDSIEVKGFVYDEINRPLPGATVHLKNTLKGTQTGLDGSYSLKAQKGDTVSISYIGYKTAEVEVSSATANIQTVLEEATTILGAIAPRRTFFGRVFHSIGSVFK